MPHPAGGNKIVSQRPGAKRITTHGGNEFVTAHADISGARRHGPGVFAWAALEQMRIVAAHAVHHLGNFKKGNGPRTAEVIDSLVRSRQKPGENRIQIVAVGAGANLVEIERGGPAGAEARLDPV